MKKIFFISYLFLFMLFACSSEDNNSESIVTLNVTTKKLSFPGCQSTLSFNVLSTESWTVEGEDSWCLVSPSSGEAKKRTSVQVTVLANPGEERSTSVTVLSKDVRQIVKVKQEAAGSDYKAPDMTGMESDATTLASKIYSGWNLGNTMEACYDSLRAGEDYWGNGGTSQEVINLIKESGFNAVRIPCAWSGHVINQETLEIDPVWINRVKEVVGYCLNNDMYVILNQHWDGGWQDSYCKKESQTWVNYKLATLWRQIALAFRDYDEHLMFAGANEPDAKSKEEIEVLHSYEQTFINTVRGTGGRNYYRNLIVQAPNTSTELAESMTWNMKDVVEDRLMIEVHYYSPFNFCLMEKDETWGVIAYFWGEQNFQAPIDGIDRNSTWGDETYMKAEFDRMKKYVDQGVPVILGEYGFCTRTMPTQALQDAHNASRAYFAECVTKYAKERGLVPFFWDAGGDIFDRKNLKVLKPYILDAVMKGSEAGVYPY